MFVSGLDGETWFSLHGIFCQKIICRMCYCLHVVTHSVSPPIAWFMITNMVMGFIMSTSCPVRLTHNQVLDSSIAVLCSSTSLCFTLSVYFVSTVFIWLVTLMNLIKYTKWFDLFPLAAIQQHPHWAEAPWSLGHSIGWILCLRTHSVVDLSLMLRDTVSTLPCRQAVLKSSLFTVMLWWSLFVVSFLHHI